MKSPTRIAAAAARPSGSARLRSLDLVTGAFPFRLLDERDDVDPEVAARCRRQAGREVGCGVGDEVPGELPSPWAPGIDVRDHERSPADDMEEVVRPAVRDGVEDWEEERHVQAVLEALLDRADRLAGLHAVPLVRRQRVRVAGLDPVLQLAPAD